MVDIGHAWNYLCVYTDDLAAAMDNPKAFFELLQREPHNYKLKGVGPITYHLGADFGRDPDGTLYMSARSYIKRMMINFETMFEGEKLKTQTAPLEKGDHPELDVSEILDYDGIKKYQSMIRALLWVISLGRFDIFFAVMTLGRFRIEPKKGHLERLKCIYGYLKRYP